MQSSAAKVAASKPRFGWSELRASPSRATPASPRPHAANEENAALRKAIEDADYEYGVRLLRLNHLDLVTVVASPATVPKKCNCAFTSSRDLDFLNAFASPVQVAKRSSCAFSTVRGKRLSPAVDNDSLEVTTQALAAERGAREGTAHGRCACRRASRLGAVAGPRAPEAGAAQQEQPPWPHDVHMYHLTRSHNLLATVGATRSGPRPSPDSEFLNGV